MQRFQSLSEDSRRGAGGHRLLAAIVVTTCIAMPAPATADLMQYSQYSQWHLYDLQHFSGIDTSIHQFDTQNGKLALVEVGIVIRADAYGGFVEVDNEQPYDADVFMYSGAVVTIRAAGFGPNRPTATCRPLTTSFNGTIRKDEQFESPNPDWAGNDHHYIVGGQGPLAVGAGWSPGPPDPNPYIGNSYVTHTWSWNPDCGINPYIEAHRGAGAEGGTFSFEIIYYYVPEPATLLLVAGGLPLLRRRSH